MTTRYYCENERLTPGGEVRLSPEESRHLLKVMRAKPGEQVIVFGHDGQNAATLAGVDNNIAVLTVGDAVPGPDMPRVKMTFLIPWIKGGKTDFLVQKLTEVGVRGLVIFQAQREVARGDESKLERLRRIALEACKQCERTDVPDIRLAGSIKNAFDQMENCDPARCFLLHEREDQRNFTSTVRRGMDISMDLVFASGPEGGWHPDELAMVKDRATPVSLGGRILRAETAPIVAAAAALTLAGDI